MRFSLPNKFDALDLNGVNFFWVIYVFIHFNFNMKISTFCLNLFKNKIFELERKVS